ncbi:MAG TPA: kynureninase, partial [Flavisolibacter sp.]|nr:kynureninase [Flavisolibacter sp.]
FFLLQELNNTGDQVLKIITPAKKGCQVSMLMLKNGKGIFDQLSANGVFADWREPDVIRVAPVALYNTFEEVWRFAKIIEQAIKNIQHEPS